MDNAGMNVGVMVEVNFTVGVTLELVVSAGIVVVARIIGTLVDKGEIVEYS
jgi:hypothetical protein